MDHLLIHCSVASMLWNFVLRIFGVQLVLPNRVINLLEGWWNLFGRHSSDIRNLVPLCLMWTIWKERNSRTLKDKEKTESQLLNEFSISLFDWS